MNFFRRLQAQPDPLVQAYATATLMTGETRIGKTSSAALTESWISADPQSEVFTILAVLADNPGVLGPDTPGLPAPADPTGEN